MTQFLRATLSTPRAVSASSPLRALVVYCHPAPESFTASVRDTVLQELRAGGAEARLIDLYAEGFQPVLSQAHWRDYLDCDAIAAPVAEHVAAVRWADALVFVYPTWWYGQPAMLKGWLDRVMAPGVAFELCSDSKAIRPNLRHVRSIDVFTTCGASWAMTRLIGNLGRRTLLRGLRPLCHPWARTSFLAHFNMDRSTPESRSRHLARVARRARRIGARRLPAARPWTAAAGAPAAQPAE